MKRRVAALVMALIFMFSSLGVSAAETGASVSGSNVTEETVSTPNAQKDQKLDMLLSSTPAPVAEADTVIDTITELQAALAGDAKTIECANITIAKDETVTIDLNGKTITTTEKEAGRNHYLFDNYGTLVINGSGTINCRGIQNLSTGSLTINGNVQINSINTNGGACVWNEGGTVVINAGVYSTAVDKDDDEGKDPGAIYNKGGNVTLNGGEYYGNANHCYAVQSVGGTMTIGNVKIEGVHGAIGSTSGADITVNGAEAVCTGYATYSDHTLYVGETGKMTINGINFKLNDDGGNAGDSLICASVGSLIINAGTFEGVDPSPYVAEGCTVVKNGNSYVVTEPVVLNATTSKGYATLETAIAEAAAGNTIQVLSDVTLAEQVDITKNLTIVGANENITITGTNTRTFYVGNKENPTNNLVVTFQNIKVQNTNGGRCIDTRQGSLTLNLTNADLNSSSQALTIGGSGTGITVNVNDSVIDAGSGYAIIMFNPTTLNITNSDVSGYGALYFKEPDKSEGSAGSIVTIVGSNISGINDNDDPDNNSFATMIFETSDITITADSASVINAVENGTAGEVVIGIKSKVDAAGKTYTTKDIDVKIAGTINGDILAGYRTIDNNTIVVAEKHKAKLNEEGWATEAYAEAGLIKVTGAAEVAVEVTPITKPVEVPNDVESKLDSGFVNTAGDAEKVGLQNETPAIETEAKAVVDEIPEATIQNKVSELSTATNATVAQEDVTIHVLPYVDIKVEDVTTQADGSKVLELDIQMMGQVVMATTDDASEIVTEAGGANPVNAVLVGEPREIEVKKGNPVTITIPLLQEFLTNSSGLKVKHVKDDGTVYYYDVVVDVQNKTGTFVNPNGFSTFYVMNDSRQATVQYDGVTGTTPYTATDVNKTNLPTAAKSGYTFKGWKFEGIDGTYSGQLSDSLLDALAAAGKTVKATAQFTKNKTQSSSSGNTGSSSTVNTVQQVTSAKTGDSANMVMPMLMLAAAAAGIYVCLVYTRKRKNSAQ